jgi:multiple sugar transport system substrate-binding protein
MDHASAVQQGPNVAIMSNSTDAERLAAWLFIKYITDAEQTAQWSMLTGYLPVRYSAYDSATYQAFLTDPDPDYIYESMTANAAYLQVDYYEFDPAFANRTTSSDARLQAGIVMEAIFTGNVTVAEAIEDMMYQLGAN